MGKATKSKHFSGEEKLPFNKKRSPTESDLENTGSTGWRWGEEHGKIMISKQDKNKLQERKYKSWILSLL